MKRITLLRITTAVLPVAFDPGEPGWKTDKDGKIEMKDGNPVYIKSDGSEAVVEGGTIGRLNKEAQTHRERADAAEKNLKKFDGIDPEKARENETKLKDVDLSKMVDAGELDRVKADISKTYEEKIAAKDGEIQTLRGSNDKMVLQNAITGSKYVSENVILPADMALDTLAKNFKVEDGKIVPYDLAGNPIGSKVRIGETADVDEAMKIILESHPHKETLLRADGHSGSGNGGAGGNRGGGAYLKRADYDKMNPSQQADAGKKMQAGELTITS